jgi:hypothetical protein
MSKNNCLYSGRSNYPDITVSTIHRAKGKEFDCVLLIDEEEGNFDSSEKEILLGHKVNYVALTRPKKSLMKHIMKNQYIYIDRMEKSRCSKANPAKSRWKKGLSHIEIGCMGDIDADSFIQYQNVQNYIANDLRIFDRLYLKRITDTKSCYYLIPEDCEYIHIGKTGNDFSLGIKRAQNRIWSDKWYGRNINKELDYYPDRFNDIYIEDIITCVSEGKTGYLHNAKSFGGVSIWMGFTVHGFAKKDNDRF